MALRPKRQCSEPGCYQLTREKRCERHSKQPVEENRPSACKRGYGRPWQEASRAYLDEHPLCVKCGAIGRIEEATVTDHIVPHRGNMALFWDQENWQPLCKRCHDRKTGRGE